MGEKTALPVVFLLTVSLSQAVVHSNFWQSDNKLNLTLAQASVHPSGIQAEVAASALQDDTPAVIDHSAQLYDQFLNNNLIIPTTGINWGWLHGHNGVDIADNCGKKVYAAVEGLVTEVNGSNGWSGGYGNFIVISHPGGIQTKYAHLKRTLVHTGSYVLQGDAIGTIGNSGLTVSSPSGNGCHLHFEVIGVTNPFGQPGRSR